MVCRPEEHTAQLNLLHPMCIVQYIYCSTDGCWLLFTFAFHQFNRAIKTLHTVTQLLVYSMNVIVNDFVMRCLHTSLFTFWSTEVQSDEKKVWILQMNTCLMLMRVSGHTLHCGRLDGVYSFFICTYTFVISVNCAGNGRRMGNIDPKRQHCHPKRVWMNIYLQHWLTCRCVWCKY